jgi:uncharacterized protein (DUF488 family)
MSMFFTIGHSTHTLPEFAGLLGESEIEVLVDVRSIPRSRRNPQFNAETFPQALAAAGIDYRRIAALGGLRSHRRGDPPSPNGYWENASFRNYADYAGTAGFRAGLEELRALGRDRRCAIMCAEALWWRCHRRIITDYLIAAGERVIHILSSGKTEPAEINPAARPTPEGTLVYPPPDHSPAASRGRG